MIGSAYALTATIDYPEDKTGWSELEPIPFKSSAVGGVSTYIYNWDFGDNIINALYTNQRTLKDPDQVVYFNPGEYKITLLISDGITSDTDTINITTHNPLPPLSYISCSWKIGVCDAGDRELLKLSDSVNAHARGFEDLNDEWYNYTICCDTDFLTWIKKTNPGVGTYAVLHNDSGSIEGGSHEGITVANLKYYYLGNIVGGGASCEQLPAGTCNDTCVYESYSGTMGIDSHLANCSSDYNYKYDLCCAPAEDCTNNQDDDGDLLIDCADPECHVTNNLCGTSTYVGDYLGTTYYCSKGKNAFTWPLPAYTEDSINDGAGARHCCQAGYYWDPTTETCIEPPIICYADATSPCKEDYVTEFDYWLNDSIVFDGGADNTDCFESTTYDVTGCCGIVQYGELTYTYENITYYQIP